MHLGIETLNDNNKNFNIIIATLNACILCLPAIIFVWFRDLLHII